MATPSYLYNAFGLVIDSELECPELLPLMVNIGDNTVVDLTITLDKLSPILENARYSTPHLQVDGPVFQLAIEGIARFRGIDGKKIIVDVLPGVELSDVRVFLLGSVLGAVLHQRAWLPLHASAVAIDGNAVAFCGYSGAGKSTLSAIFQKMGYPLICDDVAVVRMDDFEHPWLYPGIARVKLWKETLDHFNMDHSQLTRAYTRADKFHLELRDNFLRQPFPLIAVYLLENSPADEPVNIIRVAAADSMGILLEHTYRPRFLHKLGNPLTHFNQCAQIAKSIPLFHYRRPRNLSDLVSSSEILLANIRQIHRVR